MKKVQVSIIIPVYNEKANLEKLIPLLTHTLKRSLLSFQIICIDDHSTDGSYEYLHSLSDNRQVTVYKKLGKRGKAFSLTEGFVRAKGSFIVMIDGDLQYPPQAIPLMIKKIKLGADVVVANRLQYKDSFLRKFISKY